MNLKEGRCAWPTQNLQHIVQKAAPYSYTTLRVMTKCSVASLTQKVLPTRVSSIWLRIFLSLIALIPWQLREMADDAEVKPDNYYIDGKSTTLAHSWVWWSVTGTFSNNNNSLGLSYPFIHAGSAWTRRSMRRDRIPLSTVGRTRGGSHLPVRTRSLLRWKQIWSLGHWWPRWIHKLRSERHTFAIYLPSAAQPVCVLHQPRGRWFDIFLLRSGSLLG